MKISVCIAVYNGEKYIEAQLKSILIQLNPDDEVIISDDSSTDKTLDIIKSLKDERLTIIKNPNPRNLIFNFENALKHAKGDVIFMSDADDLWVTGRVEAMTKVLTTFDMAVCDLSIMDETEKIILPSYFKLANSGPGVIKNLIKNTYFGCCMAFNRKILEIALPFPKKVTHHDSWLAIVADMFFKTKFIDYQYTLYRKHPGNNSTAANIKSDKSLLQKLKYRYNTIRYIPMLLMRKIKSKA